MMTWNHRISWLWARFVQGDRDWSFYSRWAWNHPCDKLMIRYNKSVKVSEKNFPSFFQSKAYTTITTFLGGASNNFS